MFRIIVTSTVLLALATTIAQAGMLERHSVEVVYGDLNPLHPQDAKILAARLEAAAESVCAGDYQALAAMGLSAEKERQKCIKSAIDVAMTQIAGKMDKAVRANFAGSPTN